MTVSNVPLLSAPLLALLLAACATPTPDATPPTAPAVQWQASLPHEGDPQALAGWWQRFDDPLLAELITAAETGSPSLAQALARIRQARASVIGADSARWPTLDLAASANRSRSASTGDIPATIASVGPQAAWELDLFGGVAYNVAAARARGAQAQLGWHDARVSLAAEVAQAYVALRGCEAQVAVVAQAAESQARSAELTREKVKVGFDAPTNGALADAASAQSRDRQTAQQAECDLGVKALVQLTGLAEPALRERLVPRRGQLPRPAGFTLAPLPAAVLAQRPDIAAAEYELVAAAANVGVAEAQRYPHLTLSGNIGWGLLRANGQNTEGLNWGFGPALVLPLFNGGRLAADAEAARARYDEARAAHEQRLRGAVREVEEALVRIDAATRRQADADIAARGFGDYFEAVQTRWRLGAGSVLELEDERRNALSADSVRLAVQREQVAAWISLYRAAGGGWAPEAGAVSASR